MIRLVPERRTDSSIGDQAAGKPVWGRARVAVTALATSSETSSCAVSRQAASCQLVSSRWTCRRDAAAAAGTAGSNSVAGGRARRRGGRAGGRTGWRAGGRAGGRPSQLRGGPAVTCCVMTCPDRVTEAVRGLAGPGGW
jgi:hypothetical protein